MNSRIISFTVVPLILTLCFSFSVKAQQTIFNVPSADITDKGVVYLEHESQFRAWNPGPYWYGTNYFAYGFGKGIEGDITLYNVASPPSNNISMGIGFKAGFPLFEKAYPKEELRWTVGSQLLVGFEGQGVGYWGYTHLSGKIPEINTRLTVGISGMTRQLCGQNTIQFIGGIEQPITKKLSLIADWYSGKHTLGFFTSGVSVAVFKSTTIFLGYQIPNSRKAAGRQGLTFELAQFF